MGRAVSGRKRRCELVIGGERCRSCSGHKGSHLFKHGARWQRVEWGVDVPEDRPDPTITAPEYEALSEGYVPMSANAGAALAAVVLVVLSVAAWFAAGAWFDRDRERSAVEEPMPVDPDPWGAQRLSVSQRVVYGLSGGGSVKLAPGALEEAPDELRAIAEALEEMAAEDAEALAEATPGKPGPMGSGSKSGAHGSSQTGSRPLASYPHKIIRWTTNGDDLEEAASPVLPEAP